MAGPDDAEALQTDVMRFLSIICMCLMIIFSLVQSMPVSSTANKPKIRNKTLVEHKVQTLEEKAKQLQQILDSLKKKITIALYRINDKKKTEIILDERLQKKYEKLNKINSLIASSQKQLTKNKVLVQRTTDELEAKQVDLEKANNLTEKVKRALEQVERNITDVRKQQRELKNRALKKDSKNEDSAEQSFTLGFDSDEALIQLLHHGTKTQFYMTAGRRYWKLNVTASGNLNFSPSAPPGQIYEMDRRTVPGKLLRASRETVAAFGKDTLTYGVILAPEITSQLMQLMKEQTGGNLVISSGGDVRLE